jgi:hypothetical protein
LGVEKVEQEELTQDTYGYNILKVYIPNAVLTPYDTFTCYYGALLQNGRKVGWFAMEARTSSDADYEENYTLYKATLEQCIVSVEGKVYIGCQVLLGNSGDATLIKKNTAVVQFNVRKSVAINNDILVLDPDQTTTDVLESYKNLLENALTTYATKAEVYTQDQINAFLLQKVNKADIADNLTTNNSSKVLSAKQGKVLKDTIDGVQEELDSIQALENLTNIVGTYADLEALITVGESTEYQLNAKVQVLNDSTHDNNSTLYNLDSLDIENGLVQNYIWRFVGYYDGYNKEQIDEIINDFEQSVTDNFNELSEQLEGTLNEQTETIEQLGQLQPKGVDTENNILGKLTADGIWIGSDTGHWYYWNGTQYVDGGVYQTDLSYDDIKKYLNVLEKSFYSQLTSVTFIKRNFWNNNTSHSTTYSPNWCRTSSIDINGALHISFNNPNFRVSIIGWKFDGTTYSSNTLILNAQSLVDLTINESQFNVIGINIRNSTETTLSDAEYAEIENSFTFNECYNYNYSENILDIKKEFTNYNSNFIVNANTVHSSNSDSINIDIPINEHYYVFVSCKDTHYIQLIVFYKDNTTDVIVTTTNTTHYLQATKNIIKIGLYIPPFSVQYEYDFNVLLPDQIRSMINVLKNTKYGFVSSHHIDVSKNKLIDLATLIKQTENFEYFLYFTDPHIFKHNVDEYSMEKVIGTIEEINNNTSSQFVLCGGDWLQDQDSQQEAIYKLSRIYGIMNSKFDTFYNTIGNHDTNYQGVDDENNANSGLLSNGILTNLWFSKYGKNYYSFLTNKKTRFYTFDTGIDWVISMDSYRWEQIDWFATSLIENDDSKSIINVHILTNQASADIDNNGLSPVDISQNILLIAKAYNDKTTITLNNITYDFSNCTGKVILLLAGHSHYDKVVNYLNIPCVLTINCDYSCNCDIMLLDYTNNKFKTIRFGNGDNKDINI